MSGVAIRIAGEGDAEALLALYAPYVRNTAVSFEWTVPSPEEFAGRIRRVLAKYPYLVAHADGEILGYAYADAFKERAAYAWAVETSIYIKADRKRQGIGGLLHGALEEALRAQGILNLNACIAHPEKEDEYLTRDSVAFHERLGYRLVGEFRQCGFKFGRWYNMVWMEKHLGRHGDNPPEVRPFREMEHRFGKS